MAADTRHEWPGSITTGWSTHTGWSTLTGWWSSLTHRSSLLHPGLFSYRLIYSLTGWSAVTGWPTLSYTSSLTTLLASHALKFFGLYHSLAFFVITQKCDNYFYTQNTTWVEHNIIYSCWQFWLFMYNKHVKFTYMIYHNVSQIQSSFSDRLILFILTFPLKCLLQMYTRYYFCMYTRFYLSCSPL